MQEQEFEEGEDRRVKGGVVGRTVTLQMLLSADILQPGEANMSIEYMVNDTRLNHFSCKNEHYH